jgi:hypothetical protein
MIQFLRKNGDAAMVIHARENLYPGVNAHLNSYLQRLGSDWGDFHARHIQDIAVLLEETLPENYLVQSESSLQVSTFSQFDVTLGTTRPDISIFQRIPTRIPTTAQISPHRTLPIEDTLLDDDETLMGVVIYRVEDRQIACEPVTRIELLSPSNKPGAPGYRQYLRRRTQALRAGVAMVEIDYWHESRPIVPRVPSYADGAQDAHPYLILVSTLEPSEDSKGLDIFEADVDTPLPTVAIPLTKPESIPFDLNTAYVQTFRSRRLHALACDYATEPPAFERYRSHDQARILRLLEAIRAKS